MKYIVALFFLSISASAAAQFLSGADSSIQLFPQWKKGDAHSLKLTCNTTYTSNGESVTSTTTFDARFVVRQKDSSGYTIGWTFTHPSLAANEIALENQLLAKMGAVTIIYKTSLLGKFLELLNYEELRLKAQRVIDTMLLQTADNPSLNVQYKSAAQIIGTSRGLQVLLMRPIKFYSFAFGYRYTINLVQTNNLKMPNTYGGQPFDALEKVQMIRLDKQRSLCDIKTEKTVDGMQLKKAMVDYMQRIAHSNNQPLDDQLNHDKLEFSEHTLQTIDFKNGLVKKASFTRTLNLGIQNTTSELEMEATDR